MLSSSCDKSGLGHKFQSKRQSQEEAGGKEQNVEDAWRCPRAVQKTKHIQEHFMNLKSRSRNVSSMQGTEDGAGVTAGPSELGRWEGSAWARAPASGVPVPAAPPCTLELESLGGGGRGEGVA